VCRLNPELARMLTGFQVPTLSVDIVLKVVFFSLITMIIYILFAHFDYPFNGDIDTAIKAVLPTIAYGIRFEGITSVFLYSTAVSSIPLFVVALIKLFANHPTLAAVVNSCFYWLQLREHPLHAVAVILGIFASIFIAVCILVVNWCTWLFNLT
jgi:hypothetical protein